MIYDKLKYLKRYLGMQVNLDLAIHYILSHDLTALPYGRTDISGDLVYLNVMDASASPADSREYEFHKNYMDLQIDLSGTETIRIGDSDHMEIKQYNEITDFGTVTCRELSSCLIGPGNFIICMSAEPHMPGIAAVDDCRLKKCVLKIHR